MKKHLYTSFVLVCFAVILFGIGDFIYLSTDGVYFNQPVNLENNGKMQTIKQIYSPSETVEGKYSFCKYRDIPGVFQWQFINVNTNREILYASTLESSLPPGCYKNLVIPIEAAPMTPGEYIGLGTETYQINSQTKVVVPLSTNSFTVK